MKKGRKLVGIGILLVCLLAGAVGVFAWQNPKASVVRYVRAHQEDLQQFAGELLQDPPLDRRASYKGWTVDVYTEMVQFDTSAWGKNYRGFYYSPQDVPLGFQDTDMEFVPRDKGWYWEEADGNNRMYTEKITNQWYWFDMHF